MKLCGFLLRVGVWSHAGVCPVTASVPTGDSPIAVSNHSFEAELRRTELFPGIDSFWTLYDPASIVDQTLDAVGVST